MLARVITLRYDTLLGGFDDEPLREFLKNRPVISIRDHFFRKDGQPHLAVIIVYTSEPIATLNDHKEKTESVPLQARLLEEQVPLFNALRDWRTDRSRREGVPPYIVATNNQLAEMAARKPHTMAQLGEIEGFGRVKLQKYGAEILSILSDTRTGIDNKKDRLETAPRETGHQDA